jgi:predicted aconitase with swiveling domain/uncharacterized protein with ATP-grasp and redox domains
MILNGRKIYPGKLEGEVLATAQGISIFGGIDPESGVVVERGHELEGQSVSGKVLVFPTGKGSTVGSYTLYRMKSAGTAPLAIINQECETITAVGCIIAEIPCVDRVAIDRLSTGQLVRIDGEAGRVQILRPAAPPPALRGCEPGTFTEHTLSKRLPDIARRVSIQKDWSKPAYENLQALAENMPQGRIRLLNDSGASEIEFWSDWLKPHLGKTWLEAPWFPAEVYFFRRILEASGYFQNGQGQGVDPYRYEKLAGMEDVYQALAPVCASLFQAGGDNPQQVLAALLQTVIWGNQADLSIWPAGSKPPDGYIGEQRRAFLLADHSGRAAEYIVNNGSGLGRIDFILDNVGVELAYDLLLADFFLRRGLAKQIVFHAKPFPTYVSDATVPDIHEMVTHLEQCADKAVHSLGERVHSDLDSGQLDLRTNFYWISPLMGWEMPDEMREALGQADLLISKGDANYRRWLGDRHWPPELPIDNPLAYRPAPLLLIRVLKAEMVVGLAAGQAQIMDQDHPGWMSNGKWGVIQFVD